MEKQQDGRIINISSVYGKTASPFKTAYISVNYGVVGLARTVALETVADRITCNAILSGLVDTPLVQNQLAHLAQEERIFKENP